MGFLRKTVTVAVLFADIARSTQLYDILGDKKAQSQISTWLKILSAVTTKYRGIVVKTIGDEVMCTFRDVATAVAAGRAMHMALDKKPAVDSPDVGSPNIYIGIHIGKVIVQGRDIFGDVVNVASRLVALAKQRQILLSQQAVDSLSLSEQEHVKFIDKEVIKGKFEEIKIFEYIWEQLDLTMIVDRSMDNKAAMYSIELRSKKSIVLVDQIHPVVTFGRQPHNDFILNSKKVSRTHARLEYRWGKFVLIDQSSNGTYIFDKKGQKKYLKRGEIILPPEGFLCFGDEKDVNAPESIRFIRKK